MKMDLTFDEAINGVKKTINVTVMEKCDKCSGYGGHGEKTCSSCHGSGQVTSEQRTMFGTFMSRTTCSTCGGKGITYSETCSKCSGVGKVKENKNMEIKVPAGIDNGNQLRVAGKGEAGSNGGSNGDIYIEFRVKEHPLFVREDSDIYLDLPITITEAVLGCKKDIPTLSGKVKLTIPAGSMTGEKHRLKGKGIQNVDSYGKGDMYIIINVITPSKLTKEQKYLFEQLDKTDLEDSEEFNKLKKYL
jgi:molecular chaperone DnaJ